MSVRSLLELNHDLPHLETDAQILEFGRAMRHYINSGEARWLPSGMRKLSSRHHADAYPADALKDLP